MTWFTHTPQTNLNKNILNFNFSFYFIKNITRNFNKIPENFTALINYAIFFPKFFPILLESFLKSPHFSLYHKREKFFISPRTSFLRHIISNWNMSRKQQEDKSNASRMSTKQNKHKKSDLCVALHACLALNINWFIYLLHKMNIFHAICLEMPATHRRGLFRENFHSNESTSWTFVEGFRKFKYFV